MKSWNKRKTRYVMQETYESPQDNKEDWRLRSEALAQARNIWAAAFLLAVSTTKFDFDKVGCRRGAFACGFCAATAPK
jgi:hypothetical protein